MVDFGNTSVENEKSNTSVSNVKTSSPANETKSSSSPNKPFPWPILLVLLLAASVSGVLALQWNERNYTMGSRIAWDSICSIIPAISLMVVIGGIAQFRRRPILSFLSIILGGALIGGSYWAVQKILENQWLN